MPGPDRAMRRSGGGGGGEDGIGGCRAKTEPAGPRPSSAFSAIMLLPSAEHAIAHQEYAGASAWAQVRPESLDMKIIWLYPTKSPVHAGNATRVVPSADDATAPQRTLLGALVRTQVAPESVDLKIQPSQSGVPGSVAVATNLVPSAEEAIQAHQLLGAVVWCQLAPESREE